MSSISFNFCLQNSEMVAEGELRSHLDDSEKVRELQEKLAEMKSEVGRRVHFNIPITYFLINGANKLALLLRRY